MNIPAAVEEAIHQASIKTGVDEKLLQGFAAVETNFGQRTLSNTGVRGLFQITGSTWKSVRKQHGATLGYSEDYYEQAYTAALLIKDLLKKYNNNRDLVAIAYNAGDSVANYVQRYGSSKGREQAISEAVGNLRRLNTPGFGQGKEKEVFNYPVKLAKAMGEPVTIDSKIKIPAPIPAHTENVKVAAKTNDHQAVTSPQQVKDEQKYKYVRSRPFISNLMGSHNDEIAMLAKIDAKHMKQSKLVKRIIAGKARHKHSAPKRG